MSLNNKVATTPSTIIFRTAVTCWLVALCLPAMTYDNHTYYGYEVLVQGVLFGWLGLVFQAYSNITFWIALIIIWRDKKPVILAILTFTLGLSSFLMSNIMTTGDKGTHNAPIQSWGWGAILWIVAYAFLLLGTVKIAYPARVRQLRYWIAVIAAMSLAVFMLGRYQYQQANLEERGRLFTSLTAFTTQGVSNIPYYPLDISVDENTLIEVKGQLKNFQFLTAGAFEIPLPQKFMHQNKIYSVLNGFLIQQEFVEDKYPDLVINLTSQDDEADLTIFDTRQNAVVWQAPLLLQTGQGDGYYNYQFQYPDYPFYGWYQPVKVHELTFENPDYQKYVFTKLSYKEVMSSSNEIMFYQTDMASGDKLSIYPMSSSGSIKALYGSKDMLLMIGQFDDTTQLTVFDINHQQGLSYHNAEKYLDIDKINDISLLSEGVEYNDTIVIVDIEGRDIVFE